MVTEERVHVLKIYQFELSGIAKSADSYRGSDIESGHTAHENSSSSSQGAQRLWNHYGV